MYETPGEFRRPSSLLLCIEEPYVSLLQRPYHYGLSELTGSGCVGSQEGGGLSSSTQLTQFKWWREIAGSGIYNISIVFQSFLPFSTPFLIKIEGVKRFEETQQIYTELPDQQKQIETQEYQNKMSREMHTYQSFIHTDFEASNSFRWQRKEKRS